MILQILQDAFFAAIAAIGFAAISRPPKRAFIYCAVIAAFGHALRFVLINIGQMHILPASLISSFIIGVLAVIAASLSKFPAETCLYPALLPMIPGIYAYKAFGGLALCILSGISGNFIHYFTLFAYNGMMCCGILLCLVVGATLPIFIFKKIAFQATR